MRTEISESNNGRALLGLDNSFRKRLFYCVDHKQKPEIGLPKFGYLEQVHGLQTMNLLIAFKRIEKSICFTMECADTQK